MRNGSPPSKAKKATQASKAPREILEIKVQKEIRANLAKKARPAHLCFTAAKIRIPKLVA